MSELEFLVLSATFPILITFFDRSQNPEWPTRRKLLVFMSLAAFGLALLDLLIWFNPYGREINSSLPAYGMLIILVALLAYLLYHARELTRLWATDRIILAIFALLYLGLFGLLWWADQSALYMTVIPTLIIVLAWYLSRAGLAFLSILSLLTLGILVFTTGGWLFIPGVDQPSWSQTAFLIATVIGLLLSIFLSAGLLYANLRAQTVLKRSRLIWSALLIVILLAGIAYQTYWEGIWSSAHARAFEDHLPFIHFMLSLMAGVLLTLTLSGRRRWTGPLYTILVTTLFVSAFVWGWNVSAFEITERRAATVNQAILNYYQQRGSYPESLAEISPRYLLFLPPPIVVRRGGWCYQGGQDYYRLGYISGDFTYFDANFKIDIYSYTGDLPTDTWDCDILLKRFQAMEFVY